MAKNTVNIEGGSGCGCFIMWIIMTSLVAFWSQSSVNYWLVYNGKSPDCPYWLAWILTLITPVLSIIANLINEIVKLFF